MFSSFVRPFLSRGQFAVAAALLAPTAAAQELQWSVTFPAPGAHGLIYDVAAFDDGSGSALYVAGPLGSVDGVPANRIARWDGTSWSEPFDPGSTIAIDRLVVLDDGTGSALYALARVLGILQWDGMALTNVGPPSDDVAVFDDGSGSALFRCRDGALFKRVGSTWVQQGPVLKGDILDLFVHDDGSGSSLYACGDFAPNASAPFDKVARWDGVAWSAVGTAIGDSPKVRVLTELDLGAGVELIAAGDVSPTLGAVARWDGQAWSPVGPLPGTGVSDDGVYDLEVHDVGSGPELYAVRRAVLPVLPGITLVVLRFDTSQGQWIELPFHTANYHPRPGHQYYARLGVVPGSSGSELALAGNFGAIGDPSLGEPVVGARGIGSWNGSSWRALGSEPGLSGTVTEIVVVGTGAEREVFVGGEFVAAGPDPVQYVAELRGDDWVSVGGGLPSPPQAMIEFGGLLVASGRPPWPASSYVRAWDGVQWSDFGNATTGYQDLIEWDDGSGSTLYAAHHSGVDRLAGQQWVHLPGAYGSNRNYDHLVVWDDGTGEALYSLSSHPIDFGRWNGSTYERLLPFPVPGFVPATMVVFDDGRGRALYFGGLVSGQGQGVARWDGSTFEFLPLIGSASIIKTLLPFDTPGGPLLLAGGSLSPYQNLIAFDGLSWSTVDGGADASVLVLASSVADRSIFVGGEFLHVGGEPSAQVAELVDMAPVATTYCTGKTNSVGCTPFIDTLGTPSISSPIAFTVAGKDVVPNEGGFIIYGTKKANLTFHGATLCVKLPFVRTAVKMPKNVGGGCSGWVLRRNFNSTIQSGADPSLTAGRVVVAQYRQRDPVDPAGFGDGLTNGVRFTILP